MIYEPNNKNIGSKSNKLRRESRLLRYVVDRLDNNQNIKRYLSYNTLSPLSAMSRYSKDSSTMVKQTDIVDSLIGTNIIKAPLKDEIVAEPHNFVFVWSPISRTHGTISTMTIDVVIVVSEKYNVQEYGDEDRNVNIAIEIAEMLDDYTIDSSDKIFEDVGNVKFELVQRDTLRLSNTNDYIVYGMRFEVDFVGMRGLR